MQSASNFGGLTDKELLIKIATVQDFQTEQHKQLNDKVTNIEQKIIEDIENRVRNLENDTYERRGMYKLWLFVLGMISAASLLMGILNLQI
jgi:hypothetical protein